MATRKKSEAAAVPAEPIRVEARDGHAVLYLEGPVGIAQVRRLQQLALRLAQADGDISVRCEHLQYLDCASVQVLLALHETLKRKGVGMSVQNVPDSVQQTLRTAGLAAAF